jgi:uncharacterized membrane protein
MQQRAGSRLRGMFPSPNPAMQSLSDPVILTHALAAIGALGLGSLVFLRRKGDTSHRWIGRAWVGLMLATALSSFWIRGSGSFSWIHGLSVYTLVILTLAIAHARAGRIERHRRIMRNLFAGGLVIAGAFTLLPQRLLGHALWSALGVI